MDTKQIVFTKVNTAELLTTELPAFGDNDVLVKTAFSTISSGTERANITGDLNNKVFEAPDKVADFPRYAGYSCSGIVEKVGKNVTNVKVGDRVAVAGSLHKQYNLVGSGAVHKIEYDEVSLSEAAMSYISTFPMAAIRKCRLEIGESAIVMGLGVLGMLAVQLLHAAGATPVIAVDPIPEKRAEALNFGADYALDPFDPDFAKKAKELSSGGVNVAIEVTGNGKALDQVLDCMAKFGRVALLGCTRNSDFTIDYYRKVHGPGVSLIGAHTAARPNRESYPAYWTTHDDISAFLRLIALKRISVKELIAEIHSPTDAPEVYNRLVTEKGFPLVQFDWSKL